MSDTIVDMAKVSQMLDSGWDVQMRKNDLGSYSVRARHNNDKVAERTRRKLAASMPPDFDPEYNWDDDWLITDDFSPEQALTRLAYKVHGEII